MLSTMAGTGVAATLGVISSQPVAADVIATSSSEGISLGTFESTLDGWGSDRDVGLSRVSRRDRPVAVTEGEYALNVAGDGDPAPAISRPVTGLDFVANPYFVADVAPGRADGTDAPIAFQFRLFRPTIDLNGGSGLELVAESGPVTVRQAVPGRIYWDASGVETGLIDAVTRLEIGWYPADRGLDSPDGELAYYGGVVFDSIRATDSVDPVGSARLAAKMRDLQFNHGAYVRTEVTDEFDSGEAGSFVFADGVTVPYRFEILAPDQFRLTVAGTAIELGGGWS
jgi:hypothetical protein